jgi:hypothetical protein
MTSRHQAVHRKDATKDALVAELKAYGAKWLDLDSVIDGVIFFRGVPYLVDFKAPKATRTARQARLIVDGWPIWFIENSTQLRALLFGKAA